MTIDIEFTCLNADVSAKIQVARSNMKVAPEGMVFTVDLEGFDTPGPAEPGGYNPQFHDIYYFWDFGDPGSRFDAPVNVMAHQRDANTMTGPVVAHTYEYAGDYKVSVLVIEPSSGKATIASLDLSGSEAVQDPELIFDRNNTYWMDQGQDISWTPAGIPAYNNIQAALDHAWQNNKPCRLLFRDGQTWDVATALDVRGERAYRNIMMVGEGARNKALEKAGRTPTASSGVPAVLRINPNQNIMRMRNWHENNKMDVVAAGLNFQGPWDELTERNPAGSVAFAVQTNATHPFPPDYFWTHKCRFNGFYSAINTGSGRGGSTAFGISDCIIESWLNIGVYLNTNCPTAVIGARMARDPAALGGGTKTDHNVHGPIRSQHTGPLVIAKSDMFSNSGWFPNAIGWRTQQPCLRIFQSGLHGGLANITANTLEGGYQIIAVSRQDYQFGLGVQNTLIDGNLLICGHMSSSGISAEFGALTVRNNLAIRPDTPTISGDFDYKAMVRAKLPTGRNIGAATTEQLALQASLPIKVYSNTHAMLLSDGNFSYSVNPPRMVLADGFSNVTESNNLLHAPNAGTPIIAGAPLDQTVLFEPRMGGYRSAYERIEHKLAADVPNRGTFTLPYAAGRQASDYGPVTAKDGHDITVGGVLRSSRLGTASFDFGASGITITNTSGAAWSGDTIIVLYALNNPPPVLTQYASPKNIIATYAPKSGSSALGAALEGPVSLKDFAGEFRPAYPSCGAFENGE